MFLYSKTFIHKNSAGKLIALISLLLGGIAFALGSSEFIAFPVIAQAIGVILIATAVYIASSFLLRQYTVSIEKNAREEGDIKELYDLTVKEQKGKKLQTVCRIGLSNIVSVNIYDASIKKERRDEKESWRAHSDSLRYIYDTRFKTGRRIVVLCDVGDHKSTIYLCYDEELYKALSENTI